MITDWNFGMKQLAADATKYSQTAYACQAVSLQAEWQYICGVVPGVASAMELVDTTIQEDFLLALVGGHTPLIINDAFCHLFCHCVKMAGLGFGAP